LKKIASGGELSRIMLSIKAVLAPYIELSSILFDEIDSGVSGEISNKMADIMERLSQSIQVFSITHLPQVAAKGKNHYKVYKDDDGVKAQTGIVKLTDQQRIEEIAQMLDGKNFSASAQEHAKQLLHS
jgi:DNA repair protein RecN (Recombination protein N)